MLSFISLLISDPSLPTSVRRALSLAVTAPNPSLAAGLKRVAGRALVGELGLSWSEVSELLGLAPDQLPPALAVA